MNPRMISISTTVPLICIEIFRFREKVPIVFDSKTELEPTKATLTSTSSTDATDTVYESVLRLKNVQPDLSGEFECRPQGLPQSHVNLHIVKGSNPTEKSARTTSDVRIQMFESRCSNPNVRKLELANVPRK